MNQRRRISVFTALIRPKHKVDLSLLDGNVVGDDLSTFFLGDAQSQYGKTMSLLLLTSRGPSKAAGHSFLWTMTLAAHGSHHAHQTSMMWTTTS